MENKKSLFEKPYDIKDVSVLFGLVALLLIVSAVLGNNLFGIFQENINLYKRLEKKSFRNIKIQKIRLKLKIIF